MMKKKLSFWHKNGRIDGVYLDAGEDSPLVIIANGHNGFYSYGMFPYLQESFHRSGISTYSFNYSHGGVIGDSDYFDDIEGYESNCIRLEKEDILCVLSRADTQFKTHKNIVLLTHSLGGIPSIFATKQAQSENLRIDGLILVSTIQKLDFWPETTISQWKKDGVLLKKNNRTKQELPQGKEFLEEVLGSKGKWSVENAIREVNIPMLMVHGEQDEAIPYENSEILYDWSKENNPGNQLTVIPNATHTFNTKHPFAGASEELEVLLKVCKGWISGLGK